MDSELSLTRREMAELALRAAALPGAALFFSSWLKAGQSHSHDAPAKPLHDYQPKFFAPEDFQALQAFTEILIPTDDTPGARETHCAHYIDFVLQASTEMPNSQAAWRKTMQTIKDTGFYTADAAHRLELITAMSRPEIDQTVKHPAYPAYKLIKQQTAFAFYTSREGMIETLDYKGNSYNITFPACNHPEHRIV